MSTVWREIKTPLNSIMVYTGLIAHDADRSLTDEQRAQLDVVERHARRLSVVVNELLDMSRIESGRLELSRTRCDLGDLVREAADSVAPVLAERRQRLHVRAEGGDLKVECDRARVLQIVNSLLENASRYSPDGAEVEMWAVPFDGQVALTVRDHGIGVSPEDQDRLFKPFFGADDPRTRAEPGTGLGLAVARKIVELHHGSISVHSEPGGGSEFTVWLPAAQPEAHWAA